MHRSSILAITLLLTLGPHVVSVRTGPLNGDTSAGNRAESSAFRLRGLQLGYDLDHEEALVAVKNAIAADPSDPAAHNLAAA